MADDNSQVNADFNAAFGANPDVNQAFDQAFAPKPSPQPPVAAPSPTPPAAESDFNLVNPEGKLVGVSKQQLSQALGAGYRIATPLDEHKFANAEKYGSLGQQAIAGAEALGEGATFGLSPLVEQAAGVKPEDIRGRAEENPITHDIGQATGFMGSALIPGAGEANIARGIGEGAAGALGLGAEGAGFASQVTADTVKSAFEGVLLQGNEEVAKAVTQDPNVGAEHAAIDMGLAGILAGVFGGAAGAALRGVGRVVAPEIASGVGREASETLAPKFVSELDKPALAAGDFKTTIETSNLIKPEEKISILNGLKEQKPDADEIRAAANRLGAPVPEGMTSASKWVQRAEDSLINGAPTPSGMARAQIYKQGYDRAAGAVGEALGEGSPYSKAELGNIFKDSITDQIKEANKPIQDMYAEVKKYHDIIPVDKAAIEDVQATLKNIPEVKLGPSMPGAKLAKSALEDLSNLKTVDDIKAYKSAIYNSLAPTASAQEKRIVGIIGDQLTKLEEGTIEKAAASIPRGDEAKALFESLVGQRRAANAAYKQFITKVQTLSEQLGKGRIHGAQDAINFIKDRLTPEEVTQRLFAKNNSEFLKFFSKEFPEQMQLMKEYQKGVLREAASTSGELSPKLVFNKINKLEPEIRKSIFDPSELSRIKDAETYIRNMPEKFNPSGTEYTHAFNEFFHHPVGYATATARDYLVTKFIKAVAHAPEIQQATALAKATTSGWNTASKAIKSVLSPKYTMPAAVTGSIVARERLKKLVDDYTGHPEKLMDTGGSNPVPSYNTAFAATSARAVQYLAAIKPNTNKQSPFDSKPVVSAPEQAAYNRSVDIAQQPLLVLKHMQQGTLQVSDIKTMQAIYPSLYQNLQERMMHEAIDMASKGKEIPYKSRLSISLFTGQNMDSTVSPASIMAAQPSPQQAPQQQSEAPKGRPSSPSLNKVSAQYRTPSQNAEQRRATHE